MPAKPTWYSDLNRIVAMLESTPRPFVDRATLEEVLGIGRRRAQQILAPCITDKVGSSGLADKAEVIRHLRHLGSGQQAEYEIRRRRRVAHELLQMRRSWVEQPPVLVAAPVSVVNQELDGLPAGIRLAPGKIVVEFERSDEALEKLLALAMAIGNDPEGFEKRIRAL